MKPKRLPRQRIDHQRTAHAARQQPREWTLAGTYRTRNTAKGMAHAVRTGQYKPYAPAGTFDARVEDVDDKTAMYVRHVGGDVSA